MAREISSITRVGTHEPFDLQVANAEVSAGLDILYILKGSSLG